MNELLKMSEGAAVFSASQEEDFFTLLKEMAKTDLWLTCDAEKIRMHAEEDALYIELTGGRRYGLFPQAVKSIFRRAGAEGTAFERLSAEECEKVLNIFWPHAKGCCKALVRAGLVLALHSQRYIPFRQQSLFESFRRILAGKYETAVFAGASFSQEKTTAEYEVIEERLLFAYSLALRKAGISAAEDIRAFAEMSTSDCGTSSVTIAPSLSLNHSERVYIAPPVLIAHRDDKTFESCEAEMEKVFAVMTDGIRNMERLLKIELTYPSSIAIKLAKSSRWDLPGKLIKELHSEFMIPEMMGMTMTAHQFYMTLCEMLSSEKFEALSPLRKLRVREILLKIALLDEAEWQKLDNNDISW